MNLKKLLNKKTSFIIACASIDERERTSRALHKHGIPVEGSMFAVELWIGVIGDAVHPYATAMIPHETEDLIYEFEDLDLAEPEDLDLNPPLTY
jgi:hypothetical protein